MSNQSGRHAAVNAILGVSGGTYEGSFHAMFDADGIATGPFNSRLLAWLNEYLEASYTVLASAQAAFAVSLGFDDWNSLNTWEPLVSYDADAQAWFDAVSWGESDLTQKDAFNQFFVDLKAAGIFQTRDRLWVRANRDATAALTCLKSLSVATVRNAPTFTQWRGYTGNASNADIDTGYTPSTDAVNLTLNNGSLILDCVTNSAGATYVEMGAVTGGSYGMQIACRVSNVAYGDINCTLGASATGANTDSSDLYVANRTGATAGGLYKNDTTIATTTASSSNLSSDRLYVLSRGNLYSNRQIAMDGVGASLDAGQRTALQAARNALKTAIGW